MMKLIDRKKRAIAKPRRKPGSVIWKNFNHEKYTPTCASTMITEAMVMIVANIFMRT